MRNSEYPKMILKDKEVGETVMQRIPYRNLVRIEEVKKKEKFRSRTDVVNALLEIGLLCFEKKDLLQDPELKYEIYNQLKEGGLVDYFRTLTPTDFNIIWSLARTEAKARGLV